MSFELNRLANQLDWNLLRTFMVIVQERSITRASQRLNVTQPSVSAALRRLEERLEVQLIERGSGRAFVITSSGEKVYREALEIYGGVVRLNELGNQNEQALSGNIVIYRSSHLDLSFLSAEIDRFRSEHPAVTFSIITSQCADVVRSVRQRVASIGFCTRPDMAPQVRRHQLASQEFGYFCGPLHPLFQQEAYDPSILAASDVVSFEGEALAGPLSQIARHRARHDIGDATTASTSSIVDLINLIRSSKSIGCMTTAHAGQFAPDLWQIPMDCDPPLVDIFGLLDIERPFTPAERSFVNTLATLDILSV
ncbi:LysR family transcriptional regulator [uncultured Tateyamaria sp.]|uniref:LysR family transcriptional regulator n=1 Tax=uncultured Tateyamaria sp. TaxID=455651 RepID=UPI00261254B7|nr:LysR family transcriptional regulator [uncultured Tateyamaria sp.]